MTKFAICTSVYEAGRPYLADWIAATVTAAHGNEAIAVVAVDDLQDWDAAQYSLKFAMPVFSVNAVACATPAVVRRTMFEAARNCDADILVFCDMDDKLSPDALSLHAAVLETADFSYGDLQLMSADGAVQKGTFFTDAAVPPETDRLEQIVDRNWLGLSNTAVWRKLLPPAISDLPTDVVAIDWWLFTTLLKAGLQGARTTAPVAMYRSHEANRIGPRGPQTISSVLEGCQIVQRHYRSFAGDPILDSRSAGLEELIASLERGGAEITDRIAEVNESPGIWHENVSRLLVSSLRGGAK